MTAEEARREFDAEVTWLDGSREPERHAYLALASRQIVLVLEVTPAPTPSG